MERRCTVATKDTEASSISLQTFTCFPRLASELRLQIWAHALQRGTYIFFARHRTPSSLETSYEIGRCSPSARVPALLHTNHEAREVALKHLLLLGTGSWKAYFNPSVDTLLIGGIFFQMAEMIERPHPLLGAHAEQIRHLALHNYPFHKHWLSVEMLRRFPALESYTVLDLKDWERLNIAEIDALYSEMNINALRRSGGMRKFGHERLVGTEKWEKIRVYLERMWGMVSERKLDVRMMELRLPMTKEEIRAKFDERVEVSRIGEQVAVHAEEGKSKRSGTLKSLDSLHRFCLSLSCRR